MIAALLLLAAPQIVAAEGAWAALRDGGTCEAASAALLPATRDRAQARASLSFDAAPRGRVGQFALRLSRPARPGATVMLHVGEQAFLLIGRGDWAWSRGPAQDQAIIAAIRRGGGMRADARGLGGRRIVDRFDLTGAPTAIDSAAACAAALLQKA